MPDPTPTARDREQATLFAASVAMLDFINHKASPEEIVGALAEFRAQARREGREEGIGEAAYVAHQEAAHLEHYLDDIHQSDGARRAEKAIRLLVTAPPGAEE